MNVMRFAIPILALVSLSADLRANFIASDFPPKSVPTAVQIVSLKDFTEEEVKGIGIELDRDLKVHISAVGGGDKSMWDNWEMSGNDESARMFAAGWIIDAVTRDVVWDMTMDNTTGRGDKRTCEEEITLKKGSYEIYFQAYGYSYHSAFSNFNSNIDRRQGRRSGSRTFRKFLGMFSDNEDMYEEFMDRAKSTWGITLTAEDQAGGSVKMFSAPMKNPNAVYTATGVGDEAVIRKGLSLSKETELRLYALGEGRSRNDVYDYGWIYNIDTRDRVWTLAGKNTDYAGGASKNIRYRGELKLPKGNYEVVYVTDASHSREDWNARPPYDPFNYGITISVSNPAEKNAVRLVEPEQLDKNIIVELTGIRDDETKSRGFSLKAESRIHVYCLGESHGDDREMADYGWIVNAKTHERVWDMETQHTAHAGGASKNRMVDEIITLPRGDYIAYYQTDGSHSYRHWNDDPPFDETHYGLTLRGVGDFNPKNVVSFEEGKEEGVIAQLVRVRDDRDVQQRFSIDRTTRVRVYAIGEAEDHDMADYGWIEDAKTGDVVWEMTYRTSKHAGGARKNRTVSAVITLEKGEYELHYKTDGSHSYNDWNDDAPDDKLHYGITVYKEE